MIEQDSPIAQQGSVTAIDIVLEPDDTMVEHARAVNARLRGAYPDGFTLDAAHHPHITMLHWYVRTGHLAATGRQALLHPLASDRARRDCRRAHRRLTPVAAAPDRCRSAVHRHNRVRRRICQRPGSRDIQEFLIDYVANFVGESSGSKFNPHVTTGVGTTAYLDEMLAEPFEAFTFSPAGAAIYQLGTFGTAQKKLAVLSPRR